MNHGTKLKQILSKRLERLTMSGLTVKSLARTVRLPEDAVSKVLADHSSAPLGQVAKIAGAVGLTLDGKRLYTTGKVVKKVAVRKAKYLVGLVQGTMGLEAQAVGPTAKREMVKAAYKQLMSDRQKIWG